MSRVGKDGGYGRYVDDFVVIGRDKKLILDIIHDARLFLRDELGLTLHPDKVYLQDVKKGVKITGSIIKPHRMYVSNNTISHMFDVIGKWNKTTKPADDETLKFVKRINSLFGHLVHKNSYSIRWNAWKSIGHKNKVYCLNIRCLKPINRSRNLSTQSTRVTL